MIRRTIREWERIAYGSGDTEIPETQADRLAAVEDVDLLRARG